MTDDLKPLNQKVAKFVRIIRKNIFVSISIVLLAVLLTFAGVIDAAQKIIAFFRATAKPNLEVVVLDKKRPQKELTISPTWKNRFSSGFSDPISIVVALRNSGAAPATNIEIFLDYPPGVVNVKQSTGAPTPPALLGDVQSITGYEKVERFSVARIDASPISNIFEKELQLQLRFRQIVGIPVIEAGLPFIRPLSIDFGSPKFKKGEFPISYSIKYSESDKLITGTIKLRLDRTEEPLLVPSRLNAVIDIEKKNSPAPELNSKSQTENFDLHFLSDGLNGLVPLVSSDCKNVKPNVEVAKASEGRNDHDVWTTFVTKNGEKVIYVDRGDDGTLDQLFTQFKSGEWWELAPKGQAAYVALAQIIDPERNTCFAMNLGATLVAK